MIKINKIYFFFAIVSICLFIWYTYLSIKSLGFDEDTGSYPAVIKLGFFFMGILAISMNKLHTNFSLLWILWVLWLFLDFYFLGLGGHGIANILHVIFAPIVFILFYSISLYNNKIQNILFIGFVLVYVLSLLLIIQNLKYIISIQIGEGSAVTNLIYWCLCPLPILLLKEKQWVNIVVIATTLIMIIITGKRSATIAIAIITLIYITRTMREKFNPKNIIIIIIFICGIYYITNQYLENTFLGVIERLANMKEDQGSGRIPLYIDIFNVMKNNSFIDWFFGHGMGSIIITKHTNAHNDALQMLFEFGFVGLFVYVMFIIYIIKRMIILRKNKSPYYIGYMASVVITIILGCVSNLIVFYSYFAFLCAFWGFVEAKMVQKKIINIRYLKL